MPPATNLVETRILLRTATSRDALMASAVLGRAELETCVCPDTATLVRELAQGAGAIMLTEETLAGPDAGALTEALALQPPWSDVPILVLARPGADSRAVAQAMAELVNVTVIERPMRVASLVSTVRSVLRARGRQYEMRALLKGLREADQRKTEFLATLAHELRNPLAPLSTALALLERKPMEPAETQRYYALMARQVEHMTRLVNDLMEVSRITRGKVDLQMSTVPLEAVIKDAIEQSRPLVRAAGHALTLHLSAEDLAVRGDAVRLTQVFSNLLNNAAKYTAHGGQVGLSERREGSEAVIEITDTGVGIDASMLDSVFEMFVQASDTAKAAQGGLGIGLTLVRSLVALHGGSVHAASEGLGRGTTITVRLPLARSPATRSAKIDWVLHDSTRPLNGRAILVVDDNRDAADTLGELLREMGASTRIAYSGEAALQTLNERAPELAILDLGMPGMDGYELARRLRLEPGGDALTLIAITGWGQPADRERVRAAGFNHHLLKPMDASDLIALIQGQGRPAPTLDSTEVGRV